MSQSNQKHILIVGSGFAGSVYAITLAEAGYCITLIDRRAHIGGNAYDTTDGNGIRVHAYGPHLFHSKSIRAIEWIKQYGNFSPYRHRVRALLPDGRFAPLPINIETINTVFGKTFEHATETEDFLKNIAEPIAIPQNAAEYLYSRIGKELTNLFFRPYTKKMWGTDLEDMSETVVRRIPINFDKSDTYFDSSETQMIPVNGYTGLFSKILDHRNITVLLNTKFEKSMERDFSYCFNSMPIDEYFDFSEGELPYRSIKFHHRSVTSMDVEHQDFPVVNFTDNRAYTRETAWHVLPHHIVSESGRRTLTLEEPCDYRINDHERYYPIKTADGRNQKIYETYRKISEDLPRLSFIGRCGTYQYLDMDQVINQSLAGAHAWLRNHR
ncbi:UDP-galactopyranose mutase [Methylobacterium nonmethylotrophicum]|uniref:UDP-galactopyranose mutase n=1 Tax=Methylobacterium nonmethylotrophicum TaxID=1141884 RepID=A0A4Z0NTS8_9HYPH|nr:UDP-galactopyranose mutase [Methylobacterium nonmethylotrophicum]TGE00177.1 UDP-galactopyranose mutase [Methylobacterium nonmethylotrophicum]